MEDLNAEEDQGIDVRGLVPWDDGLTNKERGRGGREEVVRGSDVVAMGGKMGEDVDEFAKRRKDAQSQTDAAASEQGAVASEEPAPASQQPEQRRKRKLWLGIW